MPIFNALQEMEHKEPPAPIQTNNNTAQSFLNETMKQNQSKAMGMRFWWLIDRVKQNIFCINWKLGPANLVDYFSKQRLPSHS